MEDDSVFKDEPVGTLVGMIPDELSGNVYHIWFPYTRGYVGKVREGDMVAVRSFLSDKGQQIYSVLELMSVLPTHYAIGSVKDAERAFPGFVVEAAKSAREDWEQVSPVEETTRIRCEAIPVGIQLRGMSGILIPEEDLSIPMVGEDCYILSDPMMDTVVNRGLGSGGANTIAPGKLVLNDSVSVHMKVDELLRTHFGVFGFTGAGKSNLVSTLIHDLLKCSSTVKIVLFDLMAEYMPLLVDVLTDIENAYVLSLDVDSIPGGESTLRYYRGEVSAESAADRILRTMLLPTELLSIRSNLRNSIIELLRENSLKVLDRGNELPEGGEVKERLSSCVHGSVGNAKSHINAWIELKTNDDQLSLDQLRTMINELRGFRQNIPAFASTGRPGMASQGLGVWTEDGQGQPPQPAGQPVKLAEGAKNVISDMVRELQRIIDECSEEGRPPERMRITLDEMMRIVGDPDSGPALFMVQCDRDDELRGFSSRAVMRLFNRRRRTGINNPPVLFMYDEADEFIPQDRRDESYAASRGAAATLARRGRKFGMGMGIATQRVAYLDTNILAQPHTYFVSKLPRKYDRNTMAEAFGLTDEMMQRSIRFTKGQWLLVSFDAVGLVNVPIPVQMPNANKRIESFLRNEIRKEHSSR